MTEAQMKILEEKFAKDESLYMPYGRGEEYLSRHILTDGYGNCFYSNYKKAGFLVITRSGTCATGDTPEEAVKNAIPLDRTKDAYWKAFFACLDTGRRPQGCPFFDNLIKRAVQSEDDEPSEFFNEPLEGPQGHEGGAV